MLGPLAAEGMAERVGEEYGRALAGQMSPGDGQRSLRTAMHAIADTLTAHGFAAHAEDQGADHRRGRRQLPLRRRRIAVPGAVRRRPRHGEGPARRALRRRPAAPCRWSCRRPAPRATTPAPPWSDRRPWPATTSTTPPPPRSAPKPGPPWRHGPTLGVTADPGRVHTEGRIVAGRPRGCPRPGGRVVRGPPPPGGPDVRGHRGGRTPPSGASSPRRLSSGRSSSAGGLRRRRALGRAGRLGPPWHRGDDPGRPESGGSRRTAVGRRRRPLLGRARTAPGARALPVRQP